MLQSEEERGRRTGIEIKVNLPSSPSAQKWLLFWLPSGKLLKSFQLHSRAVIPYEVFRGAVSNRKDRAVLAQGRGTQGLLVTPCGSP